MGELDWRDLVVRFSKRQACIGVIGMGYVGLPLALAAAQAGFQVAGFDIDARKVEALNRGKSPLKHLENARIESVLQEGTFRAADDFAELAEADAILICVPTPLGRHREPDLSHVLDTTKTIARHLRLAQLVVLESTTYPGTTRELVKPILEATGLKSGKDFFLAFSPEREDPGNLDFQTAQIPKIVGGDGEAAQEIACALYNEFVVATVPVCSPEVAEAVKLTENIFRAVNIALVNELKFVFTEMGIDIFEVIAAASTKPFGYMAFYPGPGLGGHCIPIDPFYLTWKAHEYGLHARFIELAGELNGAMPRWVVDRTAKELDLRFRKGLNGATILLIGIAYKKNVDDTRESPGFALWHLFAARGAQVFYFDPYVPVIPRTREHMSLAGRASVELEPATLAAADAVVIVTDHDRIDWQQVVSASRLVIDTRNATRLVPGRDRVTVLA